MSTETSCFGSFLRKLDTLSSVSIFTINKQKTYKTKTGGVMTIILVVILIVVFAFRIAQRNRGQLMTSTRRLYSSVNDPIDLTKSSRNFSNSFVGLRIIEKQSGQIVNQTYFFVAAYVSTRQKNGQQKARIVYLQHCGEPQDGFLCIPPDERIKIQEARLQYSYQVLSFAVLNCKPQYYQQLNMQVDCVSQQQIKDKLFDFQIIYQNTIINQQEVDYKTTYSRLYFTRFTSTTNSELYLRYSKYTVQTHRNYLIPIPQSQPIIQEGFQIFQQVPDKQLSQYSQQSPLVILILFATHQNVYIKRVDHTLVDIFSYVGGLAAGIIAVIQFIVNLYNAYAFEVQFSRKLYHQNLSQEKQQEKINKKQDKKQSLQSQNSSFSSSPASVNLFTCLKDKFKCFKKDPQDTKKRLQFVRQLDLQYLFRRINIFQNMLLKLVQNTNLKLQSKQINKYRIEQAQKFRKMFEIPQYQQQKSEKSEKQSQKAQKAQSKKQKQYNGHLQINLQSNNNLNSQQLNEQHQHQLQQGSYINHKKYDTRQYKKEKEKDDMKQKQKDDIKQEDKDDIKQKDKDDKKYLRKNKEKYNKLNKYIQNNIDTQKQINNKNYKPSINQFHKRQ